MINNAEASVLSEDYDEHNMTSSDHLNDVCELLGLTDLKEQFTDSLSK